MTHADAKHKGVLEQIARRAMQAYGFLPDFSADALRELETVQQADRVAESSGIDLRHLLWVSIDNRGGSYPTAGTKLRELKTAGDEAWEDLKTGAEKAWDEVKAALHTAASKFK